MNVRKLRLLLLEKQTKVLLKIKHILKHKSLFLEQKPNLIFETQKLIQREKVLFFKNALCIGVFYLH